MRGMGFREIFDDGIHGESGLPAQCAPPSLFSSDRSLFQIISAQNILNVPVPLAPLRLPLNALLLFQIISIQNTLKEPPKAVVSMKKTIVAAFLSTAGFYLSVAVTGYAALGSAVPGDVLTGFDVSPEVELFANAAVMMHMVAAVQVFLQPLYEVGPK